MIVGNSCRVAITKKSCFVLAFADTNAKASEVVLLERLPHANYRNELNRVTIFAT